MRLHIPATTEGPAAVVYLNPDTYKVTLDGKVIGSVSKGSYRYSPLAAGHSGRVARFHTEVEEWRAYAPGTSPLDGADFRGGIFPSWTRKNTRKAALAFLIAVANGAKVTDARYFSWQR